jgi:NAD(P)-dependent dehydrogenase (short-subunit alcohol dehydrogenase family)
MNLGLEGKRALVTGGNSGIGAAVAGCLAGAGARVAINYVAHPETAESLAHQTQIQGREALTFEADVSDARAVAEMFTRLDAAWGGIDILVNNAGTDGRRAPGWEADLAAWREVIEVNLFGSFYCAREALLRMVPQRHGVVLNVSSVHERIAWSGYSAYASSKAAVGMLTQTLAQEAAPHGVRVLAVGPGAIKTPINRSVWDDPGRLADLESKIPLGRIGDADEVARMVTMLVSDVASYVVGCTVLIDGGMTDYPSFAHGG